MTFAAIVVAGYLVGSCPWGYWLPLLFRGEDVRRHGSGSIGGSNVWRTYGRTLAIPVIAFATVTGAAVIFLHRANLRRLRAGTENRFRGLRRPARA